MTEPNYKLFWVFLLGSDALPYPRKLKTSTMKDVLNPLRGCAVSNIHINLKYLMLIQAMCLAYFCNQYVKQYVMMNLVCIFDDTARSIMNNRNILSIICVALTTINCSFHNVCDVCCTLFVSHVILETRSILLRILTIRIQEIEISYRPECITLYKFLELKHECLSRIRYYMSMLDFMICGFYVSCIVIFSIDSTAGYCSFIDYLKIHDLHKILVSCFLNLFVIVFFSSWYTCTCLLILIWMRLRMLYTYICLYQEPQSPFSM